MLFSVGGGAARRWGGAAVVWSAVSDFERGPYFQGFSRAITRPAGRIKRYLKKPWVESCRVRRCLKFHGTGRVGPGQEFFTSHGSGRVTLTRSDHREEIRHVKSPAYFMARRKIRNSRPLVKSHPETSGGNVLAVLSLPVRHFLGVLLFYAFRGERHGEGGHRWRDHRGPDLLRKVPHRFWVSGVLVAH